MRIKYENGYVRIDEITIENVSGEYRYLGLAVGYKKSHNSLSQEDRDFFGVNSSEIKSIRAIPGKHPNLEYEEKGFVLIEKKKLVKLRKLAYSK